MVSWIRRLSGVHFIPYLAHEDDQAPKFVMLPMATEGERLFYLFDRMIPDFYIKASLVIEWELILEKEIDLLIVPAMFAGVAEVGFVEFESFTPNQASKIEMKILSDIRQP